MAAGDQPRPSHGASFGQGFGNVSTTWNGGIWGNTAIGSGLRNATNENARIQGTTPNNTRHRSVVANSPAAEERLAAAGSNEVLTGSGSLLSTSESDGWNGRQRAPWPSIDNTSPGLSTTGTRRSGTSPMRRQDSSQQSSQPFIDPSSNSPYFSIIPPSSNQGSLKATQQQPADPINGPFMSARSFEAHGIPRSSRHNSDEGDRYAARSLARGSHDAGVAVHPQRQHSQSSTSGFNNGAASRNGSLPPSRNGVDTLLQYSEDMQNPTYAHTSGSSSTGQNPRFKLSAQAHVFSGNPSAQSQRIGDLANSTIMNNMAGDFAKMGIARENHLPHSGHGTPMEPAFAGQGPSSYDFPQQTDISSTNVSWDTDDHGYPEYQDRYAQNNVPSFLPPGPYRNSALNPSYPHSPASSDGRRNSQSPYYSGDEASAYALQHRLPLPNNISGNVPPGQAHLLDRKLRGLQQEQHGYLLPQVNPLHFRPPFPNPYDFQPSNALRINHLNQFYPVPPMSNLMAPVIPRGPAKDQDSSHSTRSACLEEFRSSSKTNKRYELKVRIACTPSKLRTFR